MKRPILSPTSHRSEAARQIPAPAFYPRRGGPPSSRARTRRGRPRSHTEVGHLEAAAARQDAARRAIAGSTTTPPTCVAATITTATVRPSASARRARSSKRGGSSRKGAASRPWTRRSRARARPPRVPPRGPPPRRGRGCGDSPSARGRASRTARARIPDASGSPSRSSTRSYGRPLAWSNVPSFTRPSAIRRPSTGELIPPGTAGA